MRSRFLLDLTTPDIEAYFAAGGKTAIIPVGSVEMHGPHQPVGTDTIIAKAFALELAGHCNGLVLPELPYTWAGATDNFAGTLSIEIDFTYKLLEAIALKAVKSGFKNIAVISCHAPNEVPCTIFVRRFFENYGVPAIYLNSCESRSEETAALFKPPYEQSHEASLVLAAMHILGQGHLYTQEEMARDEQMPAFLDSLKKCRGLKARIGYFFQDPRQHACPSKYVSLERGLEFLRKEAATAAAIFPALEQYAKEAAQQKNQGSWR